ncbi:MAG: hypothetical protein K6L76_11235 [Agarilytica sp.]
MLNKINECSFEELVRLRTHKRTYDELVPAITEDVLAKVIEDINFLRDRIGHVKRTKLASRNPSILATYESMLRSRESVLQWLQEEQEADLNPMANIRYN